MAVIEEKQPAQKTQQAPRMKSDEPAPYSAEKQALNQCRYTPEKKGHYESYFLRANHPTESRAFWIRYTIFSPKDKSQAALGEIWAIYFDKAKGITAVKQELPLEQCQFNKEPVNVKISASTLVPGKLSGQIDFDSKKIAWQLSYDCNNKPVLLVPTNYLERPFPKAKVVCANPNAIFSGELIVNGETISIDGWMGSENHNWGEKHTDCYAWTQVAGFDNDPDAFFECATAKIRIGPFQTPWMTPMVLRVQGQDYYLNGLLQCVKAKGKFELFKLLFDSRANGVRIHGEVVGNREDFVGLTYFNPPGGSHTCLNSKLSSCQVTLERDGQEPLVLYTKHRAALEIISPRKDHGVIEAV